MTETPILAFGGGGSPAPTVVTPAAVIQPPTPSSPAVTQAGQQATDAGLGFGQASTILTSGMGATDPATLARKALLGR